MNVEIGKPGTSNCGKEFRKSKRDKFLVPNYVQLY